MSFTHPAANPIKLRTSVLAYAMGLRHLSDKRPLRADELHVTAPTSVYGWGWRIIGDDEFDPPDRRKEAA